MISQCYSLFQHWAPSLSFLLSHSLKERLEFLFVFIPDGRHERGDDLAHVGDHWQGERDPHDGEQDTEQSPGRRDRREVAISDGGENGDDEEDGLAVVPVDAVVLTHDVDPVVHGLLHHHLVFGQGLLKSTRAAARLIPDRIQKQFSFCEKYPEPVVKCFLLIWVL